MPEATLLAFSEHGVPPPAMRRDGGAADKMVARHIAAGIDIDALAAQLQADGAAAFIASWQSLLAAIAAKCVATG